MAAEKITITIDAQLVRWAGSAARKRRMTLSAVVAEALELQRQHHARERFLEGALADISKAELEGHTARAYREIFG
jgi:post-segregation antitoxin (ccd killing protein)